MKKKDVTQLLDEYGACQSARGWFIAQPGTVKSIYKSCPDIDWLAWLYDVIGLRGEFNLYHPLAKNRKLPWPMVRDALSAKIKIEYTCTYLDPNPHCLSSLTDWAC